MIKWLRRLICGDCECCKSQGDKRSKYAPERDIDTVYIGGYTPKQTSGGQPKPPGRE